MGEATPRWCSSLLTVDPRSCSGFRAGRSSECSGPRRARRGSRGWTGRRRPTRRPPPPPPQRREPWSAERPGPGRRRAAGRPSPVAVGTLLTRRRAGWTSTRAPYARGPEGFMNDDGGTRALGRADRALPRERHQAAGKDPERQPCRHPRQHIGGVVDPHVDAAGGDGQRQGGVGRPPWVTLGEDHQGEGARAGMPAREAAASRNSQVERPAPTSVGPAASHQRLETGVDHRPLDGQANRSPSGRPAVALAVGPKGPGPGQEEPHQAVLAHGRGGVEDPVGEGPAPKGLDAPVDPPVEAGHAARDGARRCRVHALVRSVSITWGGCPR